MLSRRFESLLRWGVGSVVMVTGCLAMLSPSRGQSTAEEERCLAPELSKELVELEKSDQELRGTLQELMMASQSRKLTAEEQKRQGAMWEEQTARDRRNMERLSAIIGKHGWPGKKLVGAKGSKVAFLILQHAEQADQEKYFPLLQQAAESGDAGLADAAMMEDRILMRQGKKQKYGTQLRSTGEGKIELYSIEDEEHVAERRKRVGLPPLEEYVKLFGLEYVAPADRKPE